MASTPPVHSYVLRDLGMATVFWIAVGGSALLLGDTVLRADWGAFAATAGILGFALWVLWMVLWHPHVRYRADRVTVTNIGRVHVLPWSRVAAVRQRLNLVFELEDDRSIRALGVTAKRDRGLVMGGLTQGRAGVGSGRFHDDSDELERVRLEAPKSDEPAESRWDVVPLAIGAVLAVVFVVDLVSLLS